MRLLRAVRAGARRVVLAAGLACLLGGGLAGPAGAEVGAGASPTSQAVAADAQFLQYAPPPPEPGVVCLVDSGVDPNPDTTAALVGSEGANPSWGTGDGLAATQPLVDGHPNGHGTEMAMIMAAPENGWGMVGIAPTSVRVYSVRVVPPGGTTFTLASYNYAINRCEVLRGTTQPAMTVVNLSLGGTATPTADELNFLQDSIDEARIHSLSVVAAAGNDESALFPATYAPVVAVGAGDTNSAQLGVLCSFSTGKGLDVIAPGCDSATGGIDQAFEDDGASALGFGTSQAAAVTSALLAAMRAYAPTLSVEDAEGCLASTEVNGGNLDAADAFDKCGLRRIVQAGLAAAPTAPVATPPQPALRIADTPGSPGAIVAPRWLRIPRLTRPALRHGRLVVRVTNRPRGVSVVIRVDVKRGTRSTIRATRTARSSRVVIHVHAADVVRVRFVAPGQNARPSPWISRLVR